MQGSAFRNSCVRQPPHPRHQPYRPPHGQGPGPQDLQPAITGFEKMNLFYATWLKNICHL